jgi:hypothetical protein
MRKMFSAVPAGLDTFGGRQPGVETPGYSRLSLRDFHFAALLSRRPAPLTLFNPLIQKVTTPAREARLEDWELPAGLWPAIQSGRRICGWQIGGCRSDGGRRIDRLSMVITAPSGLEIGRRLVEV